MYLEEIFSSVLAESFKIASDKTNDIRVDYAYYPAVVAKVKTIGALPGAGYDIRTSTGTIGT
jgi:hypothetical protein